MKFWYYTRLQIFFPQFVATCKLAELYFHWCKFVELQFLCHTQIIFTVWAFVANQFRLLELSTVWRNQWGSVAFVWTLGVSKCLSGPSGYARGHILLNRPHLCLCHPTSCLVRLSKLLASFKTLTMLARLSSCLHPRYFYMTVLYDFCCLEVLDFFIWRCKEPSFILRRGRLVERTICY